MGPKKVHGVFTIFCREAYNRIKTNTDLHSFSVSHLFVVKYWNDISIYVTQFQSSGVLVGCVSHMRAQKVRGLSK